MVKYELRVNYSDLIHIQYCCIDGKYRMYVARLRNGRKTSFSEYFHPFRARVLYNNVRLALKYSH